MSIEKLYKQFPDVHQNIVLKTDALRQGIDISDAAMENFRQRDDSALERLPSLFVRFQKTKVYGDKIPWVLRFEDGCPMMVRTNESSPYLARLQR